MKLITLLLLTTAAHAATLQERFLTPEFLSDLKARATTWTPVDSLEQHPLKDRDMSMMMGNLQVSPNNESPSILSGLFKYLTSNSNKRLESGSALHGVYRHQLKNLGLPAEWDWRTQYPSCIHSVRNQASCGSCWSFSATGMLEDRLCIQSDGEVNLRLSPEDMISCDYNNGGCNGGMLSGTIAYL